MVLLFLSGEKKVKKIDAVWAEKTLSEINERQRINGKLKLDRFRDLREFGAEILALARHKSGSKRKLQTYLAQNHKLSVSADRIYRFVLHMNNGVWPNGKKSKISEHKYD